ncbi:hypothetical protein WMF26_15850 [Sorangium sp. So ce185]|uniref:hypothetical protein n=1 Tax=Sorangium sp. So ce185 TaxID=3133287 RepID=UPI003F62A89C
MRLSKIAFSLCCSSALSLLVAACGSSPLGGGAGGDGGGASSAGHGASASSGPGAECGGPSPVGCHAQGCPVGQTCVDEGCAPSRCGCDPETGTWYCTDDCEGGTCVPDEPRCSGPSPVGCHVRGCPEGQTCVDEGCAPSHCGCDPESGAWYCTEDCGGGTCVPDEPTCSGPNPVGCKTQGCPEGQTCADEGCAPSECACDPATGAWACTEDCGGGTCVPDEPACSGPSPVGCKTQGCPEGQICADEGCAPSVCTCDPDRGHWLCTADCGGGTCVPAP